MNELFELPKVVHRRKNGQYATKEVAYADRVAEENKSLRFEKEKYQRMALALEKENRKLKERLSQIKSILL
jgi:cell shape-determining protein MreC